MYLQSHGALPVCKLISCSWMSTGHLGAICTYTPFNTTFNTTAWAYILPGFKEICVLNFACLCLHFSCPLHDSVMQHSPLWQCIRKLWDASMEYLLMQNCHASVKMATKSILSLWPWSDRGGHHRPFSEHFTQAMNAEMAWSFGRVSKCCKNWYTNTIFYYLYMETKLQDTKLYQGLGTMRLRLVVSENWLFVDEAS